MAGAINFGLIDPNGANALAMGFQRSQDQRNALQDRTAQMQQHQMANKLADLQYQNALQAQSDSSAEREAYKAGGDVMQGLTSRGLGKQAMAYGKSQSEQQTAKMAQAKGVYDLTKAATGAVMAAPTLANATAALTRLGQLTGTDVSGELAQLQSFGDDPVKIKAWAAGHSVDADKLLPKFEKIDNGGSVVMGSVDPLTGQFLQGGAIKKVQDPNNVATVNATLRGQNLTDNRAREMAAITREGNQTQIVVDPIRGPILVNKQTGIAKNAVDASGKPMQGEVPAKKEQGAKNTLSLLDEADKLINAATGSYIGAGVDQAARTFGGATPGDKASSQLKVLEGSLMLNQPRMEGPQSDKDVMVYKQMAGQIGDSTVPTSIKKAALKTIRALNEKYANVPSTAVDTGNPLLK
jgi:hypothetical protein